MRALVTGSHGFAGTHLRALLGERGFEVVGLGSVPRLPACDERYLQADLRVAGAMRAAVEAADPDWVFHLGGRMASEPLSETLETNAVGTHRLLAALLDRGRPVRVVVAGSSAQYGAVPDAENPIREETTPRPVNAYGWSKLAAEAMALAYNGRLGIEVIAARPFNHVGPGEPETRVCSAFARQVAEIDAGRDPVIQVGNLAAIRDFCDVRDVARGYLALAERGSPGSVYNLCSGRGVCVSEVLETLCALARRPIAVETDPTRLQAVDIPRQIGCAERARRETGWEPSIPLETSLADCLEQWRCALASASAS